MEVKICGITRVEDALEAVAAGATAVGFVFWPESPRYVDPVVAAGIVAALGPFVSPVGVFVDQPVEEVDLIARIARLGAVQLHGNESRAYCERVRHRIIKAVPMEEGRTTDLDLPPEVTLLLDAHDPVRFGGTGRTIDWERAAAIASSRPVILSGGLDPGNVAAAIRAVRPYAVDVSSGVESAPGIKDAGKVRAFVRNAVAAARADGDTGLPVFGRRDPAPGGYFGPYGGRFVPETLVAPLEELERAYMEARRDPAFRASLARLLADYAGRPTPLYEAERLGASAGGARIFLKREDLTHTGAHKINNALGQALLARRMGKERVVAETGAGQHGVATATACALLGLSCVVYMGTEDMERQSPNVLRMRLLGADVRRVEAGSRTLKDAINEALRDWVTRLPDTYYLLGSVLGPHPYPLMVRELQSVIGSEARAQMLERTGELPSAVVACIGGGSNAIGIFDAFVDDPAVRLVGVEAGGRAITPGQHAARFPAGSVGVLHGTRSFLLQDEDGNVEPTHSVAAGLDYPAVGPEHAWLRQQGRAEYVAVSDSDALEAFRALARLEGILPALESSHAVAHAVDLARRLPYLDTILVNLSGRGDKDLPSLQGLLESS